MQRCWLFLLLLLALAGTGCHKPPLNTVPVPVLCTAWDPRNFSGQAALAEVERFVALGSREAGTEGSGRAVRHLVGRLAGIGITPQIDRFTNDTPRGPIEFCNVIGRLAGRGMGAVVIGAHFDTKAGIGTGFQGANDSGSGVGLLLALASFFHAGSNAGPDLVFAFLDGEECRERYATNDGLHGSRRLAAELAVSGEARQIAAVIILDMIGDRDLKVTIPRNGTPALIAAVFETAGAQQVRSHFTLLRGEGLLLDDHVPFLEAGLPAVDLIDFEYGAAPGGQDYWHTTNDTLDKLSAASLEVVGRVVIGVVNRLTTGRTDPSEPVGR